MKKDDFYHKSRQRFIYGLLIAALVLFTILIKDYIISLLLAVIFAGLLSPMYNWFRKRLKASKNLSSIVTLMLFVMLIVIPTVFLLWEIIDQAELVSKQVFPFIERQIISPNSQVHQLPDWLPFKQQLEPYTEQILTKLTELIGNLSSLIISGLSDLTQGTFIFFLNAFVMLYAMYYFLVSGKDILRKSHNYLPLTNEEFNLLVNQVKSISRATIKGAFLIGIIQGILVSIGFVVAGIPGAMFWGSMAAFLSVIPSVGSSIVYVPAGCYLLMAGEVGYGIGLLVWGFGVVSTVDNVLRPSLVGKDAHIPDVLILVTTLGGIAMFGISGIVIGPLIAGLFISITEIYRSLVLKNQ